MKALTLHQPYAMLHAIAAKRLDPRGCLAEMPLGAIVTVSNLRAVYTAAQVRRVLAARCSPSEERFGKFDDYEFALSIDLIERLPKPIPIGGDAGLWTLPKDVAALLMTRVATWQQMHNANAPKEA